MTGTRLACDSARRCRRSSWTGSRHEPRSHSRGDEVCIGEASHGTHEFYRERAKITKRLIDEKSFNAVAVEADWPDAYGVNRFVRNISDDQTIHIDETRAVEPLERMPSWHDREVPETYPTGV